MSLLLPPSIQRWLQRLVEKRGNLFAGFLNLSHNERPFLWSKSLQCLLLSNVTKNKFPPFFTLSNSYFLMHLAWLSTIYFFIQSFLLLYYPCPPPRLWITFFLLHFLKLDSLCIICAPNFQSNKLSATTKLFLYNTSTTTETRPPTSQQYQGLHSSRKC